MNVDSVVSHYILSNAEIEFIRGPTGIVLASHLFCGLFCPLILETSIMGSGPIDPKELLKGLDSFLNRDGEVKSVDGIAKIFR